MDPATPAAAAQALWQLDATRRVALAVAAVSGPDLFDTLVAEVARALPARSVMVSVFADDSRATLRVVAMHEDGQACPGFDYPVAGSPCAQVVGRDFRYMAGGVRAQVDPQSLFAVAGFDAYSAFPLSDSHGRPLGVLAALDREPIARGDAVHAEAVLKVVAGRLAAELERRQAFDDLRRTAEAVSSARPDSVFADLAASLARILRADTAFIARRAEGDPGQLATLALQRDGVPLPTLRYALDTSPCGAVLGRGFLVVERDLAQRFPDDEDLLVKGPESYAGHALVAQDGSALGVIAIGARRPLADVARIEAVLRIFAVRAAAEVERLAATEALRRSEASYRGIFEAAPDSIFVHDWQTFAIRDLNRTAEETLGYTRAELFAIEPAALMAGEPPYDPEHAFAHLNQARLGRCAPFEWRTRLKDGSLQWQEVHLKPVVIDGAPQILAFTRNISERKRAEQQLRKSEEQYRAIFDASADALMLWNSKLVRVDVNPAHRRIFGFAREDVVGVAFERLPYPEDMAQPRLDMVRRALAGEASRAELEAVRKDGTRILTELRTTPFVHGGEPHALQIARDITERKRAEATLQAQEERYRSVFDASDDPIVLWDARLTVVDVNAAFVRLRGYGRASIVGRHWTERVDAHELVDKVPLIKAALAGKASQVFDRVGRADGGQLDMDLRYLPMRVGDERFVLSIGRDISEQVRRERALAQSEAQLRASEEQYRAIFNASVDALTLWDSRMRRVDINAAYERLYGWARDEVIGKGHDDLPFDEVYYAPRQALVRRALAGEVCSAELESIRKDGQRILTEIHAVPFSHRGEPHVLVIGRDITERRAAEAERVRLEEQLRQAQKMEAIGQLTGGIAHDFNNFLTSVLGYIVLAQERSRPLGDERLARQLAQAQQAGERARDLVAQMLAFARRKSGRRELLAPAPLLHETVELLRPTLPSSVLLEVAAVDAALPAIEADPVQMGQVLMNLFINARDAVAGAGHVRVGLHAAGGGWRCAACAATVVGGRWVEIRVDDSGCGIAAEVLHRVFDPFFTTKPAGQGTGMGLAMVHGIVHDHSGHVVVDSRVGEGTRFRVLLPAAAAGLSDAAADAPRVGAGAAPALSGRVLLVEDDAQVGAYLAEQLDAWGLEVVVQADPLAALRWLEDDAEGAQLLVTDLTMPHLSGLELAQRARRLRPGLPVLLVSADLAAADAQALAASGVRAALAKPIDAQALRLEVVAALAASG